MSTSAAINRINVNTKVHLSCSLEGEMIRGHVFHLHIPESMKLDLVERVKQVLLHDEVREHFAPCVSNGEIDIHLGILPDGKVTLNSKKAAGGMEFEDASVFEREGKGEKFFKIVKRVAQHAREKGLFERGEVVGEKKETSLRQQVFRDASIGRGVRDSMQPLPSRIAQAKSWVKEDGIATVVDGSSVWRNALAILGLTETVGSGISGVLPGALLVYMGVGAMGTAAANHAKAAENGDAEGKYLASVDFAQCSLLTALGVTLAGAYLPIALQKIGVVATAFAWATASITLIGAAFYGLLTVVSTYRLAITASFRATFNHLLFDGGKKTTIEHEGLVKTAEWLQSEVTLSRTEEELIRSQTPTDLPDEVEQIRDLAGYIGTRAARAKRAKDIEANFATYESDQADLILRLLQGKKLSKKQTKIYKGMSSEVRSEIEAYRQLAVCKIREDQLRRLIPATVCGAVENKVLETQKELTSAEVKEFAQKWRVQQSMELALRKKWEKFERRSSDKALAMAQKAADSNLADRLRAGDSNAVTEAKVLVAKVSRANFDKIVKYVLLIVIGMLGIAAFMYAGPLAAAILFLIGAFLWLAAGDLRVIQKGLNALLWWLRNLSYSDSKIDEEKELTKLLATAGVEMREIPSGTSSLGRNPSQSIESSRSA